MTVHDYWHMVYSCETPAQVATAKNVLLNSSDDLDNADFDELMKVLYSLD